MSEPADCTAARTRGSGATSFHLREQRLKHSGPRPQPEPGSRASVPSAHVWARNVLHQRGQTGPPAEPSALHTLVCGHQQRGHSHNGLLHSSTILLGKAPADVRPQDDSSPWRLEEVVLTTFRTPGGGEGFRPKAIAFGDEGRVGRGPVPCPRPCPSSSPSLSILVAVAVRPCPCPSPSSSLLLSVLVPVSVRPRPGVTTPAEELLVEFPFLRSRLHLVSLRALGTGSRGPPEQGCRSAAAAVRLPR
ncbi:hypothetical protein JZ751_024170 [Albula glossodonta]|uniref:Uncharacterized protein n=1 Tax=Albula glossodonta TaxID=121402 RepID=A0A8T2NFX7_9TELE|nr:hypothetical protein JZ751_024170 [Albula glossodonta]